MEHTDIPFEQCQTADETVRGESDSPDTLSGILVLLVDASTSPFQDACQIISNDENDRQVRRQYGHFEVIFDYTEQNLTRIWTTLEFGKFLTAARYVLEPPNPLVEEEVTFKLEKSLRCYVRDLDERDQIMEEKGLLEVLEHEKRVARETLKAVQGHLLPPEETQRLNQEEETYSEIILKDFSPHFKTGEQYNCQDKRVLFPSIANNPLLLLWRASEVNPEHMCASITRLPQQFNVRQECLELGFILI